MEKQSFEKSPQEKKEQRAGGFHFEEIAEIESAVISLVEQLKEKIDNGEYDTIISDDVGGRIPTLILRKILKERKPKNKLNTLFVASGQTYIPSYSEKEDDYTELQDYIKHFTKDAERALVVTQYIRTGKTIANLSRALKDAGLKDFDVAAVDIGIQSEVRHNVEPELGDNMLYVGSDSRGALHEEHEHLSGVRKVRKWRYSPHPKRAVDVIAEEGRELSDDEEDN